MELTPGTLSEVQDNTAVPRQLWLWNCGPWSGVTDSEPRARHHAEQAARDSGQEARVEQAFLGFDTDLNPAYVPADTAHTGIALNGQIIWHQKHH